MITALIIFAVMITCAVIVYRWLSYEANQSEHIDSTVADSLLTDDGIVDPFEQLLHTVQASNSYRFQDQYDKAQLN